MHLSNDSQRDSAGLNWRRTGLPGAATVLLIHPVGYDLTWWDEQVQALAPQFEVVTFDLPGHGGSVARADGFSFAAITAQVAQLIEHLGNGAVHVVGISVGGMVAQTLALAYPTRVRSLCLIATAASFADAAREGMRARALAVEHDGMAAVVQPSLERWFSAQTRRERPALMARVTAMLLADDTAVHAAMWRMIATFDVEKRLGEIACPALVLVGELDPSTPPAAAAVIARGIAGAQMVVLADTSHIATVESPEAVNEALLKFLRTLE